ncbi:MAG: FHA domain-containing protein [bacterium]
MIKIILKFKNKVVREFKTNEINITIGRSNDNIICIDNLAVSKHHARITESENKYFIEDLYSTNGTFKDKKLIHREELKNGNEVIIGKHTLQFFIENTEDSHYVPNIKNIDRDKTMVLETEDQKKRLAKLQK